MTVNEKMTSLADAIREKTGGTEPLTIDGMTEAVQAIQSSKVLHLSSLYTAVQFTDYSDDGVVEIVAFERIRRDISNNTMSWQYLCRDSIGIKKIIIKSDRDDLWINGSHVFNGNGIEEIDLSEFKLKIKDATNIFLYAGSLKKIIGELDFSHVQSANINSFYGTYNLEEVRFKKGCASLDVLFQYNQKLSATSIQSIIDGLADLTGKESKTLTLHTSVVSNLTEEQVTIIADKNWVIG